MIYIRVHLTDIIYHEHKHYYNITNSDKVTKATLTSLKLSPA